MTDSAGNNGDRNEVRIVAMSDSQGGFPYRIATGRGGLNSQKIEHQKPATRDVAFMQAGLRKSRANAAYGSASVSHSLATTQLVVCAVANAIGKWIAPPVTPDKVLRALGKA